MSKQKDAIPSYEELNKLFPQGKAHTRKNGMKVFGDYKVGVMAFSGMQLKESSFLHFDTSHLEEEKTQPSDVGRLGLLYGLKFHISLPEKDRGAFRKGCNIVIRSLTQHRILGFKVIRDHERMSETVGKEGKDITIYVKFNTSNTVKDWVVLFNAIMKEFLENSILPGYKILGSYVRLLSDYSLLSAADRLRVDRHADVERRVNNYLYYRYEKVLHKPDPLRKTFVVKGGTCEPTGKYRSAREVVDAIESMKVGQGSSHRSFGR